MKLKIYDEKSKECTDSAQMFLRLVHNKKYKEDISMIVVDREGNKIERSTLMYIDQDEKFIILSAKINEDIPLKTDIHGHLLTCTGFEYEKISCCWDTIDSTAVD